MKEAFVNKDLAVIVRDIDVPVPDAGQVLIRVIVSGTNPKDWKIPQVWPGDGTPTNQGDDIAGYVEAVGDSVVGFKKGDKVAAFHQVMKPHGSYAEYAIALDYTTFHVPVKTSFEVVYGGATAVGAFVIKFAQLSGIHPLIVIAGKGSAFVETLIDVNKGDTIIDYREGDEAVRAKIKAAAGGRPIHYAYDAVSEKGSYQNIGGAMAAPGNITTVISSGDYRPPEGILIGQTIVGSVHMPPTAGKKVEDSEFSAAFLQLMGRGLAQGWFLGHPHEVRPGGLAGIEGALQDLKAGKASAVKYVVRVGETEGAMEQYS